MPETKKNSYWEDSNGDIFTALKNAAPALFGAKTFADVQDFLVPDDFDSNKVVIRFIAETDVNNRQKNVFVRAEWVTVFNALKAQFPTPFTGKVFDDIKVDEFLTDVTVSDPIPLPGKRIVYKEENNT